MRGKTYTLSELPIYSYGAMLCLSLIVGWFLTLRLAERDGLPRDTMANCYFITAVGALVGARLLYVVTNSGEFESMADLLNVRRGGMVAYGGFPRRLRRFLGLSSRSNACGSCRGPTSPSRAWRAVF